MAGNGPKQHSSKSPNAGHNHALDGLRFFAFLLVFFFHALQWSP